MIAAYIYGRGFSRCFARGHNIWGTRPLVVPHIAFLATSTRMGRLRAFLNGFKQPLKRFYGVGVTPLFQMANRQGGSATCDYSPTT